MQELGIREFNSLNSIVLRVHQTSNINIIKKSLFIEIMTFGILQQAWLTLLCMCSPVQIKMYWEEGYWWQNVDYQFMEFCMMHSYDGYPGYGRCFYGAGSDQAGPCLEDAVFIAECDNREQRQQWTFVNLRNGEFQIKAVTTGQCMEKEGWKNIRMRPCDATIERQRFFQPGMSTTTGGSPMDATKFIVSQGASRLVMGTLHHPKQGEVVEMTPRQESINSDTLYWETV